LIRRLATRLAWAVFVVWAVVTGAFVLNNVIPGDPAKLIAGPHARASDVERVRADLGLDRPLPAQYAIFMRRLVHRGAWSFDPKTDEAHASCAAILPGLHVDLGRSYTMRQPVVKILAERFPRTLVLALVAVVLQLGFGVVAGVLAARKRNSAVDYAAVGVSLLGISAPTFLIGVALQFVFAYKLRILPKDGYGDGFAQHAAGLVLPALTLGIFGAAYYTRLVRDEMLVLLKNDYVRTARAKGLAERTVIVRHALRNALVPLVTVVGLDLGALVGGAIVTETIFRWPGLGALSVNALLNRDGPVIIGTVIVASTAIVLSNVVVDLCYAALDPRVRVTRR
jgi:peptide/nickel transport system permease protein